MGFDWLAIWKSFRTRWNLWQDRYLIIVSLDSFIKHNATNRHIQLRKTLKILSPFFFKCIKVRKIEKLDMTKHPTLDSPYLLSSEQSNVHSGFPQKLICLTFKFQSVCHSFLNIKHERSLNFLSLFFIFISIYIVFSGEIV